LARDIQRYLADEVVEARPPSAAYRLQKFVRRHKPQAIATTLVVFALLGGIAGTTWGLLRAEKKRTESEQQQRRAEAGEKLADQRLVQVQAERGKAEAAADRERKAHEAETITLADAHTSLGLIAAEQNNFYEAVLWFASAANLAHADPQRELANRTRFATWARRLAYPVGVLPHPGQDVTRIVFHPSDDYLLVFTGGRYTIYDVRTGQAAMLRIASTGQGCAEWNPDGKLLVLARDAGRVDVYSFPECRLLHALKHPGEIHTLRFSDDGRYLALGSNVVRVWSTAKKAFLAGELPHPQAIEGIDFDPAGPRLVTSCLDNMARVFSIDGERLNARPLFSPAKHTVRPTGYLASGFVATFVKNARLLVSKDYGVLRLLDAKTGAEIKRFDPPSEYLTSVRVSSDRSRFIMCSKRNCQLGNAGRLEDALISLEQPQGTLDAAFSPDEKSAITVGLDGMAHFWSALGGQPLDPPLPHQDHTRHVAYSPSGKLIATVQEGGLVRIWRLPPPARTLHVPARLDSALFRLALSANGRYALASGTWPGRAVPRIQVYETASGSAIGPPLTTVTGVNGADFSPDSSRVIAAVVPTANGPGGIVIWDWGNGNRCFPTIPTPSEPADVAYSPRGDYAVAVCASGEVLIIDANTGKVRNTVNHRASKVGWWQYPKRWVVFSPDGSQFATLGLGNVVRLWTATGELACSVQHRDIVRQAVFSPKGDYLATASRDYSAQVCNSVSGKVLAVLRHPGWVEAVQFSPDQRQLLTACTDGMGRLWEWEKGRLACPGFEHKEEVWDARFVPHQPWILTVGNDSMIRAWEPLTGKAVVPPLAVFSRIKFDFRDLMVAADGRHVAAPGAETFDVIDMADAALVGSQNIDLTGLQVMAELYAGRQIIGSGSVKLTAEEWLQRWKSLLANYSADAPVELGDAAAGVGGFAQVVRRVTAASVDAEARRNAAAARRLALIGKPLQVDGAAVDGELFDWSAYHGKVTLIEFWKSRSTETDTLLSATRAFYDLYHDLGLEVVGVSLDDDRQLLDRFLAEKEIPWATLHTDGVGLNHPLAVQCGVSDVPMCLLVDRDGKIVLLASTAKELAARLRDLLGPPFQGPLTFLDLQSKANWRLSHGWGNDPDSNSLASLPRGEGDFGGVKFNVRESALRLGSKQFSTASERIENVGVNLRAAKLYFLHSTVWGTSAGALIGEYVVHYADGGVCSIPIVYGKDVRDWWDWGVTDHEPGGQSTRATVAWQGKNPASTARNANIRLFLSVWKNPRPSEKIASLDYVSAMTDAAPFCVAITAEGPSAPTPAKTADQ
jgi:WD40 repeat protein